MDEFAVIRSELDEIDQWRGRLADLGVMDTGPLMDRGLELARQSLEGWTQYYRGLVEKAEKEMVK